MESNQKDIIETGPWTGCTESQVIAWAESVSFIDASKARVTMYYDFIGNILYLRSAKTDDAVKSDLTREMFDEDNLTNRAQ